MAEKKPQTKDTSTLGDTEEIQIDAGVFFVTCIQADPVHGNYTRLTIHYARRLEETQEGKQQKQRFLLRDDLAMALAEALENCVAENIAEDVTDRANPPKRPN